MSEYGLLMVGDVHVSDTPPSTRKAGYREEILSKLLEIGKMAGSSYVDAVVFVGDIFHSKKPAKTSHQTVRAVAQILQGYPKPVYIVPGNHDYAGRNVGSLKGHPLGTVSLMENVRLIGLPNQRGVDLYGGPILHGVREEEGLEGFDISDAGDSPVVVVAHSAIFPPGEAPKVWEAFDAREVAGQYEITGAPVITWYGHIHEPHGVYDVPMAGGETPFANLGAISRGSLHEEGALDRIPQVGLLTLRFKNGPRGQFVDSWSVQPFGLESAKPAGEVFRIEEVAQERSEAAETNAFVEALSAAEVDVFSVETAIQAISEHSEAPQPVRARAIELIEEVS